MTVPRSTYTWSKIHDKKNFQKVIIANFDLHHHHVHKTLHDNHNNVNKISIQRCYHKYDLVGDFIKDLYSTQLKLFELDNSNLDQISVSGLN